MNTNGYQSKLKNLENLIGNTPLLEISLEFNGEPRTIYAKAENFNLTGSIKDRMAFYIIKNAYERDEIDSTSTIIEATSGNTGIAFSAIGKILGNNVVIFMPNWLSQERINLIKSYGAKIILVSKEEGGFLGSINKSVEFAKELDKSFLPKQFSNKDNCHAHYNTTGPEIYFQLINNGIIPSAFIAGVGTGGTIMGTGSFLKEKFPDIKLFPLEPSNSPTLSTGYKVGCHRIQGISDEFIPSILDLSKLDRIIEVDDGDAIIMSQKLAKELGLGVGISSGANLLGALIVQNELGKDSVIVTVFPDDNKKYLSTDLFKTEPVKNDFLSPGVNLLSFRAFNRDCKTCNNTVK
jgi:cysteine synthase A